MTAAAPRPASCRRRTVIVTLGMCLTLAGCGSAHPDVTPAASALLTADVARLGSAARMGDPTALDNAVRKLRSDVAAEQRAGRLSGPRAAAILAQVTRVLADAASITPRPTPAPSASPHDKGKGGDEGDKSDGHD